MEGIRNSESASRDPFEQQFALLDVFIPGFSLFLTTVQTTFGINLAFYLPLLLIAGSAAWAWSYVWEVVYNGFQNYLMSSVYIRTDDEIFNMVMGWVAQQSFSQDASRFIANTNINSRSWALWRSFDDEDDEDEGDTGSDDEDHGHSDHKKTRNELKYTPSYGSRFFMYRGQPLLFRRTENSDRSSSLMPSEREELQFSCFGRNPAILKELLLEARELYLSKDQSKTIIYRGTGPAPGGNKDTEPSWRRCMARFSRPLSTIILNDTVKQRLMDDVSDYLNPETRRWYANRGIPYRRGYLLYGPPGTGKSSLSFALAGFFKLRIYVFSLSSPMATEDNVSTLFNQLPLRCVVLLEDIDSAGLTQTRDGKGGASKKKSSSSENRLSLSGLLNVLDGVASQEGRVLIMTTNHLDKLDPALIRPGRVDMTVGFNRADRDAAASIFRAIYTPYEGEAAHEDGATATEKGISGRDQAGNDISSLADDFAAKFPQGEFSPAEIQGLLLQHKHDPPGAIQAVDDWIETTRKERAERESREAETLKKEEEGEYAQSETEGKATGNKNKKKEKEGKGRGKRYKTRSKRTSKSDSGSESGGSGSEDIDNGGTESEDQ